VKHSCQFCSRINRDCPFHVSVTVRVAILFQDNDPAEECGHAYSYRNMKRAISVNSGAKLTAVLRTYLLQHLQSGLAQVAQLPNWIRGN
jgi:hypothetical protein